MLRGLKRDVSRFALVIQLGLFLTGCTLSNGAEQGRVTAGKHASSQPPASTVSDMSNMKMPGRPPSSETKEMKVNSVPNQVAIENFSFVPVTLTVKAGTKVTWVNRDDVPHTATETDKRFNSKTLDTDDQFAFTFSEPGTYNYFCALHPKMTGQIIVK